MLWLIMGPPRSGKSEYAEQVLARFAGPTIYIGTLPNLPVWHETIRRHEMRRPAAWSLLELGGNPERDIEMIVQALDEYRNVLLDGIAIYVFQLMTIFDFEPSEFERPISDLVRKLSNHAGEIVVVDQPAGEIRSERVGLALGHFHRFLARRAGRRILIKDGRPVPLILEELINLDRRVNTTALSRIGSRAIV